MTDYEQKKIDEVAETIYKRGYSDGKRDSREEGKDYKDGLNDAWECARKLMLTKNDGGLASSTVREIFDLEYYDVFAKLSSSEVMEKIIKWEDENPTDGQEEKACDTCGQFRNDYGQCGLWFNGSCTRHNKWIPKHTDEEIKIGDEVIYHALTDGIIYDNEKGVVVGVYKEWVEVKFPVNWSCLGVHKNHVTKTGRHFPEMEEVLEKMKGGEDRE